MAATMGFAKAVEEKGGFYVDAPVSGGTIAAVAGNLTIMAGGSDQAFAQALPVLKILGERITHVGGTGAGQVAKAANQVIVGLNIGAVAEALALAKAAGVDPGLGLAVGRDHHGGRRARAQPLPLHRTA